MRPQKVSNEEILCVTRQILLEKGVHCSVQVIADELGLSQPAIFKRFKTKRNLIIEAFRPPTNIPLWNAFKKEPDERPFNEQLFDLLKDIGIFFETIAPVINFIQETDITHQELMDHLDVPIPVITQRYFAAWITKCYDKGLIRKTNFNLVAMNILGSIQMDIFRCHLMKDNAQYAINNKSILSEEKEIFYNELFSLLWQGLDNEK